MKRGRVHSRIISSVGYDSNRKILEIEFKKGTLYQYYSVPQFEFDRLISSKSVGKYFDKNIKKGPYSYIKLY